MALQDTNVDEERRRDLSEKDRTDPPDPDAAENLPDIGYDLDEAIKAPGTIEHMIMSIKVIRLLGQLLKSYYGSLKADPKVELAEDAYMLLFRSIHHLYARLLTNVDKLIAKLTLILDESGATTKDKREGLARSIMFFICVFIPEMYLQEITRSVATKNLSGTFHDVLVRHNTPGVRLIDISIKMASLDAFPLDDARALHQDVRKDLLMTVLLKNLVLQHLYLFPRPMNERQSICDRLGIPVEETKHMIPGR